MNSLRQFEYWLKNGNFIPLALLLVMLNGLIFWWHSHFIHLNTVEDVNNAVIDGLIKEKERIKLMLNDACDSNDMQSYKQGHIGPIRMDEKKTDINESNRSDNNTNVKPNGQQQDMSKLGSILDRATVRINAGNRDDQDGFTGSGFFISPNLVVTNRHVIENADENKIYITSQYQGPNPIKAKLIAVTPDNKISNPDFALLSVNEMPKSVTILSIGMEAKALQTVTAAGYPGAYIRFDKNQENPATFYSRGFVNVLQKQANGMTLIVHTADMAPGSSGGPLVNNCATLVGINTFLTSQSESAGRTLYALSAGNLRDFLDISGATYTKDDTLCAPDEDKQ